MLAHAFAVRRCLSALFVVATLGSLGLTASPAGAIVPITPTIPPLENPPRVFRTFGIVTTDGAAHLNDAARAVAALGTDTVYAAGFLTDSVVFGIEVHRWHIQKRRPNGVVVWAVNSTFSGEANAVAVAPDGSVVAAGFTTTRNGVDPTFAVAKWNASGVHQWTAEIAGVDRSGNPRYIGEAKAIALASNGDVAVVGNLLNESLDAALTPHDDQDAVVVLLNGSNGAERWRQSIKGTRFAGVDNGAAVAVDPQDRIIATGSVRNSGSDKDIFVASFTSAGTAWISPRLNIAGSATGDDEATAVAVDGLGQIYTTGYRTNLGAAAAHKDFWIGKFAGNGTSLFQRDLAGNVSGGEDRGLSVRFDSTGNLYAAGFTTNTGSPGSPAPGIASNDMTVGKWDAVTGNALWTQKLDGGANGEDRARSVAVLGNGDLAIGGFLTSATTGKDFSMLRYSTAGAQTWLFRRDGTLNQDDNCAAVVFDGLGWAVGAGLMRNGVPLTGPAVPTLADFAVAI